MERTLRVAYILHRFPVLSESFIARELHWIRAHGVEVMIFSLPAPRRGRVPEQARELLAHTRYSPWLSWAVLRAQLHFVRRSPARYLRALAGCIGQTYREPLLLARALLLFPKSVYFARQIEDAAVDHIHAHFVWLGGIAAGVAAELLGLSFSVHAHAFDLFRRNRADVGRGLRRASRVITISHYNRAYIARLCPLCGDEVDVVYSGVESELFRPAPRGREGGRVRIVSVGRLIEKKGHPQLIAACGLLAGRGLDFECVIVGAGPLERALRAASARLGIAGRVRLCGAMGQAELRELLQSSDIFALPAVLARGGDQDGLPVALIEAMACGLPVVTTAISGIPELVRDEVNGLFVRPRDAHALAGALGRLILDAGLRARLGAEARQTILEHFQITRNTAALAEIFREVSQRGASSIGTKGRGGAHAAHG
ncbi:MAG: glycosyltransferase family 4 protein [Chloroflexales bacterium]|nr:glycosyltransferase family 4 protein [Chloroflexales bacterium]